MHIQDFHARLTTAAEESRLFQALRTLSQVEDPKSLTDRQGLFDAQWDPWPPAMETGASTVA
ncbi:MAG TPA: hypothetical protein VGM86_06020 [Thermoanaerobaculia bacterium]|jgi:hypothetical protein